MQKTALNNNIKSMNYIEKSMNYIEKTVHVHMYKACIVTPAKHQLREIKQSLNKLKDMSSSWVRRLSIIIYPPQTDW